MATELKLPDMGDGVEDVTISAWRVGVGDSVSEGDIILGFDDLELEMTAYDFLGYVRRNYLVGDSVTINLIRDGRQLQLPFVLR